VKTFSVYELVRKRALISRESAGTIREVLARAADEDEVVVDFTGIDAVTPSFVDELLAVVEEAMRAKGRAEVRVIFLHPPTRLSSKFAAVGRAHQLKIGESQDGTWVITAGLAPGLS
jgi:hypothetical protein